MLRTCRLFIFVAGLITMLLLGCKTIANTPWAKLDPREVFGDSLEAKLVASASVGKTERSIELIELGADVNARGKHGLTPLYFVVLSENLSGVDVLLRRGANPNAKSDNGRSVVHIGAMISRDPEILSRIIKYGGNPSEKSFSGEFPINLAISRFEIEKSLEKVKVLISAGAELNVRSGKWGVTPLMSAVLATRYDIAVELLNAGADVCLDDENGISLEKYVESDQSVHTPELQYQLDNGFLPKFNLMFSKRKTLCRE